MAKPMANLFSNLESEFDSLQKSLINIDASIRKVTGKEPRYLIRNLSYTYYKLQIQVFVCLFIYSKSEI